MRIIVFALLIIIVTDVLSNEKKLSCDEQGDGYEKIEIFWDEITTRLIPGARRKGLLNFAFMAPVMYCDQPKSSGLCTDKSVWFTFKQFVNYKVFSKPVVCSFRHYSNKKNVVTQKIVIYLYAK
jgi:hypothetical protein